MYQQLPILNCELNWGANSFASFIEGISDIVLDNDQHQRELKVPN